MQLADLELQACHAIAVEVETAMSDAGKRCFLFCLCPLLIFDFIFLSLRLFFVSVRPSPR